jgi:hypothetical protein
MGAMIFIIHTRDLNYFRNFLFQKRQLDGGQAVLLSEVFLVGAKVRVHTVPIRDLQYFRNFDGGQTFIIFQSLLPESYIC